MSACLEASTFVEIGRLHPHLGQVGPTQLTEVGPEAGADLPLHVTTQKFENLSRRKFTSNHFARFQTQPSSATSAGLDQVAHHESGLGREGMSTIMIAFSLPCTVSCQFLRSLTSWAARHNCQPIRSTDARLHHERLRQPASTNPDQHNSIDLNAGIWRTATAYNTRPCFGSVRPSAERLRSGPHKFETIYSNT